MSQAIYNQNVADAVLAFHKTYLTDKNKIWNLGRDFRNYYFGKLETERMKTRSKDGKSFHIPYLMNGYSNVQLDSFFNPDSLNRQDLGEEATVYWSMQKTHFAVDRREPGWGSNASPSMIYNYLELQSVNMMDKFYDANERFIWTLPTDPNDGSAGQVAPWGIPYWVVQRKPAAVGPNGGTPCSYTNVAGLRRTTYPKQRNYTATSAAMSHADFVKKAAEMIDMMLWKPARTSSMEQAANYRFEMVSGYQPFQQYQDLVTASNDNLGFDMGKYRGDVPYGTQIFRGVVWSWTDALTSATLPDGTTNAAFDSKHPVYLLDWSTWELVGADGWYKKINEPITLDNPHNTVVVNMDTIYNLFCHNPRANGVIRTA